MATVAGGNQLEEHRRKIAKRARQAWSSFTTPAVRSATIGWVVAVLCSLTALISVIMVYKWGATIVELTRIEQVDKLGQVVSVRGSIARVPKELQTRAFISTYLSDVFGAYASRAAMQTIYGEAESMVDPKGTALDSQRDYWNRTSSLRADGTWDPKTAHDAIVKVPSVLDYGPYTNPKADVSGEMYRAEMSITPQYDDGSLGPTQLMRAVVVLTKNSSAGNPFGMGVYYLSWDEVR